MKILTIDPSRNYHLITYLRGKRNDKWHSCYTDIDSIEPSGSINAAMVTASDPVT